MKKCPAFFKYFIAALNSKDMKLPTGYTQRMQAALSEKVHLRDPYCNIWTVNVERVGNNWHFVGDGWVKFVKHNGLETGDLLVFEYVCQGRFHVKIYGKSGTEKKGLPTPITSKSDEKMKQFFEDIEDNDYDIKTELDSDSDDVEIVIERENDNGSADFEGQATEIDDNVTPLMRRNNALRRDHNNSNVEETREYNTLASREHNNSNVEETREFNELARRDQPNTGDGSNINVPTRAVDLTARCYAREIFAAGLAEQPKNPYFVTKKMRTRGADVFVPQTFIKDYNIDFTQEMRFRDPRGQTFRVKYRRWADGRTVISGGWSVLCCINLVEDDDLCICEFIQGEGRSLTIKVSFVRYTAYRGMRI